jgi:ferredoxin
MSLRVSVDHDACAGSGFCCKIAPQLFALDDDEDVARVLLPDVPEELEAAAREAEDACPTTAIVLEET